MLVNAPLYESALLCVPSTYRVDSRLVVVKLYVCYQRHTKFYLIFFSGVYTLLESVSIKMKFRECCFPFSSGRNGAREEVHGGIIGLKR